MYCLRVVCPRVARAALWLIFVNRFWFGDAPGASGIARRSPFFAHTHARSHRSNPRRNDQLFQPTQAACPMAGVLVRPLQWNEWWQSLSTSYPLPALLHFLTASTLHSFTYSTGEWPTRRQVNPKHIEREEPTRTGYLNES